MDRKTWGLFKCVGIYPEDLKPKDIDLEIREPILKINQSGWVWSTWCCSGHKRDFCIEGASFVKACAYLGFIVETKNIGELLTDIYQSFSDDCMIMDIKNYKNHAAPGYEQLIVHIWVQDWVKPNKPDYDVIFNKLNKVRYKIKVLADMIIGGNLNDKT